MRGKIVNLAIGFTNIVFGILLIIFTTHVPQDKTLLTIQEGIVVKYILFAIYILMTTIIVIDIIQYYNHKSDTVFNTAYLIGIFVISFVFIKEPVIAVFNIISGVVVVFKSLKENLVEIDSTTAISIAAAIMIACVATAFVSFSYKSLGQMIKNKENKSELAYKKDYFKYITELGIEDAYINVKKDGKYGYINKNGDVVINFEYDYASPFVKINMNNKDFEIALVCQNGSSKIILKNGRTVMSYRSESSDENYQAKLEELQDIYTNTLGQPGTMKCEIEEITDHINKVPAYREISPEYTFRYDYNDEYDLIVTQSNLGLGDKFELAKKNDLSSRVSLNTTDLDYDADYLYLFSNGNIPFYETSKLYQGWFTSYGKKNEMQGKAQILDFFGNKILLKNYNNYTIYFSDSAGNPVSEIYKDIYVCNDNRYIVRLENNDRMKVIDKDYNKVFDTEYDLINPRLSPENLYLCMNTDSEIEFNDYGFAKMKFLLVNDEGNVILDNIEQIYNEYYEMPNTKGKNKENYNEFLKNIKTFNYHFVGDKFYNNYNN